MKRMYSTAIFFLTSASEEEKFSLPIAFIHPVDVKEEARAVLSFNDAPPRELVLHCSHEKTDEPNDLI